jgi:hypothetical protein
VRQFCSLTPVALRATAPRGRRATAGARSRPGILQFAFSSCPVRQPSRQQAAYLVSAERK